MNTLTVSTATFAFLASGPRFSLDIPAEFDPLPDLSSPLLNGKGGRSFVFHPTARDAGLDPGDNILVGKLSDRDGRVVDLFERVAAPPLWRLRWSLAAGTLYTHLREEDGAEMAATTTANISVVEAPDSGLPFVIAYPPLEFGASAWPGYQEEAVFASTLRGDGFSIALERPGTLRVTDAFIQERSASGGLAVIRLGLGQGIDATVSLGTDMPATEAAAVLLRESLRID